MKKTEEFSGQELVDLLVDADVESAIVELSKLADRFPDSGFKLAKEKLDKYRQYKNKVTPVRYIDKLAGDLYKNLQYWFDTKWLVTRVDNESLVIDRVIEVITNLIYGEDVVAPEDFVDTYTLAFELNEFASGLSFKEMDEAYGVARIKRLESAKKGLEQSGITRGYVLINSPTTVYKKVTANTKLVGRINGGLQVIDTVAKDIQDTLWIDTAIEEDVTRVYVDVYRLYNPPTASKNFLPTLQRIADKIEERKKRDKNFNIEGKVYKEDRLVIYQTDNSWIVLGGNLRVFLRGNKDNYKLVFSMPLYELRVKDLENIFHTIN